MRKYEILEDLVLSGQIKIDPEVHKMAWIEVGEDKHRVTFITFGIGVKGQGEPINTWASTENRAWELFWAEVMKYIGDRQGTLYWRMMPTIERGSLMLEDMESPLFTVLARLALDEEKELVHGNQ